MRTGSRSVRISVFVSSIGVMVDEFPLYKVAKNVCVERIVLVSILSVVSTTVTG